MRCEGCGLESTCEEFFHSAPKSFSRRVRKLCPQCYRTRDDGVYRFCFWVSVLSFTVGLLLALLFPNILLGTYLMNVSFISVFTLGSTIIHELGHVLAA